MRPVRPLVHAGRRAASEIRKNTAISSQLAISDEPPADMNGVVCPVSGMSRLTPPTITKICSAERERETAGQQLAERVPDGDRGTQTRAPR